MLKFTAVLLLGVVLGILAAPGVEEWEKKFTDPPGTPEINVEIILIPPMDFGQELPVLPRPSA